MKTITHAGKRYRLSLNKNRPLMTRLFVTGPGLLIGAYLPEGITLESSDLRRAAAQAIEDAKASAKAASKMIQHRVRDGIAGLGRGENSHGL